MLKRELFDELEVIGFKGSFSGDNAKDFYSVLRRELLVQAYQSVEKDVEVFVGRPARDEGN